MKKIEKYVAISGNGMNHFKELAEEKILDGWQPFGSLTIVEEEAENQQIGGMKTTSLFIQAFVKYRVKKPPYNSYRIG